MKRILTFALVIVAAFYSCAVEADNGYSADWQIVDVNCEPFVRNLKGGPPEIQMNLSIRNTTNREMFIWGQDFGGEHKFYLIESFIEDPDSSTWERQNIWMCGSVGRIGWIRVEPGETISTPRVLFKKYVGRQMVLTFRQTYSDTDSNGVEIRLAPFKIPDIKQGTQLSVRDSLAAGGFGEEALTQAFESGRALAIVEILSVREEKDKNSTSFYYYRTRVLRTIIDGDFIMPDPNDSLELFAGASYGRSVTPGSKYALFVIQEAPDYFIWANRNNVIKVDSMQCPLISNLVEIAERAYEESDIYAFRKPARIDSIVPDLPRQLLSSCEKFRLNPERRAEFAKLIAESDLGSQLHQSRPWPWSSKHIYVKPKVTLSRSQALNLLGEPTLKSGRIYLWYCGKDWSYDVPGDWAGVLTVTFDNDFNVEVLKYGTQEEWKWHKE